MEFTAAQTTTELNTQQTEQLGSRNPSVCEWHSKVALSTLNRAQWVKGQSSVVSLYHGTPK